MYYSNWRRRCGPFLILTRKRFAALQPRAALSEPGPPSRYMYPPTAPGPSENRPGGRSGLTKIIRSARPMAIQKKRTPLKLGSMAHMVRLRRNDWKVAVPVTAPGADGLLLFVWTTRPLVLPSGILPRTTTSISIVSRRGSQMRVARVFSNPRL